MVGSLQHPITDGQTYSGHPSVGYLRIGTAPNFGLCTATLVGTKTVVTAAHCLKPGQPHVMFLGTTSYQVQSMQYHPNWDSTTLLNDIGIVILSTAPPITPSVASQQAPSAGLKITLIGYGNTSEYASDAGIKRIAYNTIKELQSTRFTIANTGGGVGNTCQGDSGGPAFATLGGAEVQVGVTSAGVKPCGTLGIDTRVDVFHSWLKSASGGDLYEPDIQKPVVTITSPQNNATVGSSFSVTATATDNVGVVSVELLAGSVSMGTLTQAPYTFPVTLAAGQHTLTVAAKDKAGNRGQAQVAVQVGSSGPSKKGFGTICTDNSQCTSGICAFDPATNRSHCTQKCNPTGPVCPSGAQCLPTSASGVYLCGPPAYPQELTSGALTGSCAVAGGPPAPILPLLLALGLLSVLLRRRR